VRLLQAAGRAAIALVALGVLTVVGLQFGRAVHHNLVLSKELGMLRRDVADLQRRKVAQERTIRRLHDPQGAVPEIHDRLRLTRSDEAIIYLKGGGDATAPPLP
jgi:hypothetical protein